MPLPNDTTTTACLELTAEGRTSGGKDMQNEGSSGYVDEKAGGMRRWSGDRCQGAGARGQVSGGRNHVGSRVIGCGTAILAVTVHGRDARATSQ